MSSQSFLFENAIIGNDFCPASIFYLKRLWNFSDTFVTHNCSLLSLNIPFSSSWQLLIAKLMDLESLGFLKYSSRTYRPFFEKNISLIQKSFFLKTFHSTSLILKKFCSTSFHKLKHQSSSLSVFADLYFREKHSIIFDEKPLRQKVNSKLWVHMTLIH